MTTLDEIRAREEMIAALRACRETLWDEWHAYINREAFNGQPIIRQIDAALASAGSYP
jgi:hypothetical protein